MSRKSIPTLLTIVWVVYHMFVGTNGNCDYYAEEDNEDWYVMYQEEGSEVAQYGPISEEEAKDIVQECEDQADTWIKKYGTVYRLAHGSNYEEELSALILFASVGLLWIVFRIFDPQ